MKEKLKEYGLSQYEANTYLALLESGISTSSKIATKSGVPYGKIYPVLNSLEQKGFIKIFLGRPKRFMAIKPELTLTKAVKKKAQELEDLKSSTGNLLKALKSISSKKDMPIEKVHIITGYKNYLNISSELRCKAKKTWRTISRIPVFKPHLDAYRKSIKKGLKVKVLTNINEKNTGNVKAWLNAGAELRDAELPPTRFSIIDETDVVFRISGNNKDESYLALWIENQSLAKTMAEHFDSIWTQAKKINQTT